ncbi:hypothetical protein ACFQ46_21370 [Kineococcus sp. GCM10028916]|uniref:hypothetical protein n=1 Tax=Kineococcus sp. GCM10028916 TaxID=3273394 RepID=UPI00362B4AD2
MLGWRGTFGASFATALRSFIDEQGAIAKSLAPTPLWSSGTVASYWLSGDAQFRLVNESLVVHLVSTHEDDEGMEFSHWTRKSIDLVPGKPHIVGEYGMLAAQGQFGARAARYRTKNAAYLAEPKVAAAMA